MTRIVARPIEPQARNDASTISRGLNRLARESSMIRPRFSGSWVMSLLPPGCKELDSYELQGSTIRILSSPAKSQLTYHLVPWEFTLDRDLVRILNRTIDRLAMLPPPNIAMPIEDLKNHVLKAATPLIRERLRAERGSRKAAENEWLAERLARVVVRHTVGLGLLEILLADDRIEDIYVDAPPDRNPISVNVSGLADENRLGRCSTNIIISSAEVEAFSSKLRMYSGRPFSEAHPVLETDIDNLEARATLIGPPLSPHGTALALRRHATSPWTLLKLAYNGTIDSYSAGLLSFLIDGRSTALVCGARGSGKSSFLSAMMFEFPFDQRIITIEDTLELPVKQMQTLGYKVQSILVEQNLAESREKLTDDALRVSLRLGESAIVLGEVRGKEAQTLYESMRTGRAGSSVLGTIHGDSARSVYERVVFDLGIPKEAFSATDLVITMGLHRPGGSQRQIRKVAEICELTSKEGEFKPLVSFDGSSGKPSDHLIQGSRVISRIAESWSMSYEEALFNIDARVRIREALLEAGRRAGPEFLSPDWVGAANHFFWSRLERGNSYDVLVGDFTEWLNGRSGVARGS